MSPELRQEQIRFAEEVAETLSLLPNCYPMSLEERKRQWPPNSKPWLLPYRGTIVSAGQWRCLCSLVESKDMITARLFIDQIETDAHVANWDNTRKLSKIYLVLCNRAAIWWNSLKDAGIARDNWNAVKNEFLASYEPRYTAKITCANFKELTQHQGEGVHDYYLQVHDVFFKMCEAKPADIATLRVVPAIIASLAVPVAAADLAECK